jgi:hypothetical protein
MEHRHGADLIPQGMVGQILPGQWKFVPGYRLHREGRAQCLGAQGLVREVLWHRPLLLYHQGHSDLPLNLSLLCYLYILALQEM